MGLRGLHSTVPEGTEAGTAPVAAGIEVGDTAEMGIGVVHPRVLPKTYWGTLLSEARAICFLLLCRLRGRSSLIKPPLAMKLLVRARRSKFCKQAESVSLIQDLYSTQANDMVTEAEGAVMTEMSKSTESFISR